MKEIILTMDRNGHVQTSGYSGVSGEHMATLLTVDMASPIEEVQYYRLLFAGEQGSKITQQLFAEENAVHYTLPSEVTNLGTTVFCQLCGYKTADGEIQMLFKSDAVPLIFGTALSDTASEADTMLTHRLIADLEELESFTRDFAINIGTVETGDSTDEAMVTMAKAGHAYTLYFSIPRGQPGVNGTANLKGADGINVANDVVSPDFEILQEKLTAGKGIQLVDNVISSSFSNSVYQALTGTKDGVTIEDDRTTAELAGNLLFVNPAQSNTANNVYFYTTGENTPQAIYCFDGKYLSSDLPVGCIIPGRIMAIYIDGYNRPIYLNPPAFDDEPITITANKNEETLSMLQLSVANLNRYLNGKLVVAMAANDIPLDGTKWYGPYSCPVQYFNGTEWTGVENLENKIIYAGQPVMLYIDYNSDNYCIEHFRILNVPQHCGQPWHSVPLTDLADSSQPLTMHYKRCGDTVTVRFSGYASSDVEDTTWLYQMPEAFRPLYATNDEGLVIHTANAIDGHVYFSITSDGNLYLNGNTLHGAFPMTYNGWPTTSFSYTL